jgi:hypothetical protein
LPASTCIQFATGTGAATDERISYQVRTSAPSAKTFSTPIPVRIEAMRRRPSTQASAPSAVPSEPWNVASSASSSRTAAKSRACQRSK